MGEPYDRRANGASFREILVPQIGAPDHLSLRTLPGNPSSNPFCRAQLPRGRSGHHQTLEKYRIRLLCNCGDNLEVPGANVIAGCPNAQESEPAETALQFGQTPPHANSSVDVVLPKVACWKLADEIVQCLIEGRPAVHEMRRCGEYLARHPPKRPKVLGATSSQVAAATAECSPRRVRGAGDRKVHQAIAKSAMAGLNDAGVRPTC